MKKLKMAVAAACKNVKTFPSIMNSTRKSITWPQPADVWKNFWVVVLACGITGLYVFGADAGLGALFGLAFGGKL